MSAANSKDQRKDITRSSKTLRAILDATRDALIVTNEDWEIVLANSAVEDLWGWRKDLCVGMRIQEMFSPHISFLPLQFVPRNGDSITINAEGQRRDGKIFFAEVSLRRIEVDGLVYHLLSTEGEMEREKLEGEVREHTFSALERFASGLALEYNNILTGVIGNLDLAMDEIRRLGRPRQSILEGAYNAGIRAREMTKTLLDFAKGERSKRSSVNLPELVEDNCLIALGERDVEIEFEFDNDLNAVFIDPNQVGQVIHRLLTYFADSLDEGKIMVSAMNEVIEEEDLPDDELATGDHVHLSLVFEGPKVHPEEVEHMFEPFSRCGGKSNGLTLSICHAIVTRQNGHLTADYGDEGELILHLLLPASEDVPSTRVAAMNSTQDPEARPVNVLVMDDERLVSTMIEMALQAKGHRVTVTSDGQDALDEYSEALARGERYDLVLLDITVPSGMGARSTCQELLQRDPLATCIVMSGDTADDMMLDYEAYGFVGQLDKPIDLEEMAKLVEDHAAGGRSCFARMMEEECAEDDDDMALENRNNIVEIDFRPTNR